MKKACLMAITMLWTVVVWAQMVKVEGRLTDTSGQPLQWVVVKHVDAATNKMLNYCQTDAEGRFSIEAKVGNSVQITSWAIRLSALRLRKTCLFRS